MTTALRRAKELKSALFSLALMVLMGIPLALNSVKVDAFSGSGSGTQLEPYLIANCVQLQEIQDDLAGSYRLANNIDCSDTVNWNGTKGFLPIGEEGNGFTGTLDGDNFEIQNLTIIRADDLPGAGQDDEENIGLFSHTYLATITDLHITDSIIKGYRFVGGIAGQAIQTTISSSSVNDGVLDNNCSPGDCVWARYGEYGGGLVGYMGGGSITSSSTGGPVKGSGNIIGGLVGATGSGAIISKSHSTSDVDGGNKIGGLVGHAGQSNFYKVYATGDVEGNASEEGKAGQYVGGLIGYNEEAIVERSYATGNVHGESNNIGGLVGEMRGGAIADSYASGDTSALLGYAGGFVGSLYGGSIERAYSIGSVTAGSQRAGGFAGEIGDVNGATSVIYSFAAGEVVAPQETGGFAGIYSSGSTEGTTVSDFYYDISRTGQTVCSGVGFVSSCAGINQNNNEPNFFFYDGNTQAPLSSWSFNNVWDANIGDYPTLNSDSIDISPLCEEVQATATSGSVRCELQYSVEPDPELVGATTWEARYKKGIDSTWTDVEITDSSIGEMVFMDLDPETEYQLALRPTNNIYSQWAVMQLITPIADSDVDADGSPDITENDGPNSGDANDDGTLDALQANVLSYINPLTNQPAILEAVNCNSITGFQIGSEASESADADFNYPMGLASFHITCEDQGETATIRQYFYGVEGNENYVVRKWMNDGSYKTIPGYSLLGMLVDGESVFLVEYGITDGGEFDDDGEVNGLIIDPSGPALSAADSLNNSGNQTSQILAGTGQNLLIICYMSAILLLSSLLILRNRRV